MVVQGDHFHQSGQTFPNVYSDRMNPGPSKFAARVLHSPVTGSILITDSVQDSNASCGDGVWYTIEVNGSEIEAHQIPNGSGVSIARSINVNVNDQIALIVKPGNDSGCDGTLTYPTVQVNPPSTPDTAITFAF